MLSLMLSLMLVACGGDAVVPTYSGGTAVTLSDQAKSSFTSGFSGAKNTKLEAYKTSDDPTKVKSSFTDGFSKNGWSDKSADFKDQAQSIEQLKGFLLGYEKDSKFAAVIGLPGIAGSAFGVADAKATDTIYLVITGDK
jgi:hypothetical protein